MSPEHDIDPNLLAGTQAYLDGLHRCQTPPLRLKNAWDEFYQTYDPVIRRFAVSCGTPDVEDSVQQVWLAVHTHLRDFRYDPEGARFTTWLYTLVENKVIDHARRRARRPTEDLTNEPAWQAGGPDDPHAEYERRECQAIVRAALAEFRKRVSENSYRVAYLRLLEGQSTAEVCSHLGFTREQVYLLLNRGKPILWRLIKVCAGNGPVRKVQAY